MAGRREVYQTAMREGHALAWALKWEAAVQKYRQALAEFPEDAPALISIGVALTRLGRAREALDAYEAARSQRANDTTVLARIAELRQQCDDLAGAAHAYAELGELYFGQGNTSRAKDAWERVLAIDAGDVDALRRARRGVARAGLTDLLSEFDAALAPYTTIQPAAEPAVEPTDDAAVAPATEVEGSSTVVLARSRPLQVATADEVDPLASVPALQQLPKLAAALGADGASAERSWRAFAEQYPGWLAGQLSDVLQVPIALREPVLRGLLSVRAWQERGLLSVAIDECLQLIALAPTYVPGQIRLAQLLAHLGQADRAANVLRHARELYELQSDPRGVAIVLSTLAAIKPDDVEVQIQLAEALQAVGSTTAAVVQLQKTAEQMLDRGQTDQALELFARAFRLQPDQPELALRFGGILEQLGRLDEAIVVYQDTWNTQPGHPLLAAALFCARTASAEQIDPVSLKVVLGALREDGPLAESILRHLQAWVERVPGDLRLLYGLGMALLSAQRSEAALEPLLRASRLPGALGAEAGYHAAGLLVARGELDQAAETLHRAVWELDAEGAGHEDLLERAARLLCDTQLRRQDVAGAVAALEVLKRLNPNDETLYPQLAEGYYRLGRLDDAVVTFVALAELFEQRGATEAALGVYRGIVQLRSDFGPARLKLAEAALRRGDHEEAATELEELADAYFQVGNVELAVNALRRELAIWQGRDARRALAVRERIARLAPDDVTVRRDLIAAYLQLGQASRALAEGRAFVDELLNGNRLEDAVLVLSDVLRLDPWNLSLLEQLGDLHARLGHVGEATALYERLLELAPPEPLREAVTARLAALQSTREGNDGAVV